MKHGLRDCAVGPACASRLRMGMWRRWRPACRAITAAEPMVAVGVRPQYALITLAAWAEMTWWSTSQNSRTRASLSFERMGLSRFMSASMVRSTHRSRMACSTTASTCSAVTPSSRQNSTTGPSPCSPSHVHSVSNCTHSSASPAVAATGSTAGCHPGTTPGDVLFEDRLSLRLEQAEELGEVRPPRLEWVGELRRAHGDGQQRFRCRCWQGAASASDHFLRP